MAIFKPTPHPSQDPTSSLRLPAMKRISLSSSQRLSTITEGKDMPPPTVPLRSILRPSTRNQASVPMAEHPAFRPSQDTFSSGPPAYGVHGSSIADSEDLTAPVEGDKLAQLRRGGPQRKSRGGCGRLLIIAAIALIVIGLAVGLGVGLTVGRRSSSSSSDDSSSTARNSSTGSSSPSFPLGERSFVTALRVQQKDCTSKAATWRCSPEVLFSTNNTTSLMAFNWIISNTSAQYATQSSGSTSTTGMPANLSISTTNPFDSVTFSDRDLTYIADSSNSSSARYVFNFTTSLAIAPNPPITSNGQASKCFFNSTVVSGSIYLNSARTYPDVTLQNSTSVGGFEQWPYAVEFSQVSPGGDNIPDCYETVNGVVGSRIVNGFTVEPVSNQCICDYRNF
ncbi:hypothetical protein AMS68_003797 [Peltaster fructicola]|uniref:Tat pathway signal sequence n=1 Tax=Peltaster fructicola TaxID=286661 RepID=A0A6H0XV06_9PEZI|nr:hypothetical protein AMS68_003797 [Peltaster fructicola]